MTGSPTYVRVFAVFLVLATAAMTAANVRADSLAERYAKQRNEMVSRLESYAQARERGEGALVRAEKAAALARELDDGEALQIAERAKIKADTALSKIIRFQNIERDRLRRFDRRAQHLIDARRVEYVSRFKGTVSRTGGKDLDAPLAPGDTITTGQDGFMEVSFLGGSSMTLGPNTTLRLLDTDEVAYYQARGTIYFLMRCAKSREACRHLRVTPGGTSAVRGTAFETEVDEAGSTTIRTFEGKVVFISSRKGRPQVEIFAGRYATIAKDGRVLDRGKGAKAKAADWNF